MPHPPGHAGRHCRAEEAIVGGLRRRDGRCRPRCPHGRRRFAVDPVQTWSFTSLRWSRARPRLTSSVAIRSTSTARGSFSRRHSRWRGYRPRIVFASSIAVAGAPLPDVIGDDHCTTPLTEPRTQKAIVELLLCDYTRQEFVDGVGVRLPTICVRPGAPNRAVSRILLQHHPRAPERRRRGAPSVHERSPLYASPRAVGLSPLRSLYSTVLHSMIASVSRCLECR